VGDRKRERKRQRKRETERERERTCDELLELDGLLDGSGDVVEAALERLEALLDEARHLERRVLVVLQQPRRDVLRRA
jgi:hypothetical protein